MACYMYVIDPVVWLEPVYCTRRFLAVTSGVGTSCPRSPADGAAHSTVAQLAAQKAHDRRPMQPRDLVLRRYGIKGSACPKICVVSSIVILALYVYLMHGE